MTDPKPFDTLVAKVLNDPVLLQTLSDRVYRLLQLEFASQRDRLGPVRGKRP